MKVEFKEEQISFSLPSSTRNILFGTILIGIISAILAFTSMGHEVTRHAHHSGGGEHVNHTAFWSVFLIGTYFTTGIAILGIFFTAISHVTGSHWFITIRRVAESFTQFLPVALIFIAAVVFFSLHDLYEWSNSEIVRADKLLNHKSGWLNPGFFAGRLIALIIIWIIFGFLFRKNSVSQDADKAIEHTKSNNRLAPGFILFFALSFSVFSYDLLMSLTPHWFSTMWAVYCFAGIIQSTFATFAIIIYYLKKNNFYGDTVNENHIHDVGKFMLGFTVFWAYIAFSQFMLIYYANLPEETFMYEQRLTGGWTPITISIPFIKFIVPFLLLLNRPNKRDINFLVKVALWILIAESVELYWIVFPSNFEHFNPLGLILSLGFTLGMFGLFGFIVLKGLEKNKLIPVGDPRLEQCLNHHQ